jgi:hypothetical protein
MLGRYIDLGNPVSDHPYNAGLVRWWLALPNNQGGSRLFDLKGREHGVLTDGPTWAGGPPGAVDLAGIKFDGTDDRVVMPGNYSDGVVDNFALEVAFRAGPAAGQQCVAHNGNDSNGWGIFSRGDVAGGAVAGLYGGAAWLDTGYVAAEGELLHATLTRRGGSSALYLNGVQAATTGSTPGFPVDSFEVGHEPGHASRFFGGTVYSVRAKEVGITASEAWGLYDQWRRGYPDLLRRYDRRAYLFAPAAAAPGGGTTSGHLLLLGVG